LLNNKLTKADEDLRILELENDQLKKRQKSGQTNLTYSNIIDFTSINIFSINISEELILQKMREVLQNTLYSVNVVVPRISELQKLYLYEVRAGIDIKISCEVDPENDAQLDLLEGYENLDNISIRNFIGSESYDILRDDEELFAAFRGRKDLNYLIFHTRDAAHIKLLGSMALSKKTSDDDDYFPYPYIFKPPAPPGDIVPAGQLQAMQPTTEEEPEFELYCKYCGSKLKKEQKSCEKCGAKLLGENTR